MSRLTQARFSDMRGRLQPHAPFTSSSSIVVLELSVDSCREENTLSVANQEQLGFCVLKNLARDVHIMQNSSAGHVRTDMQRDRVPEALTEMRATCCRYRGAGGEGSGCLSLGQRKPRWPVGAPPWESCLRACWPQCPGRCAFSVHSGETDSMSQVNQSLQRV